MKKIALIIITASMTITGLIAQNVDDALRYSQIFYSGTARFNAMGGAFTALGGDLSALSQNPAGLGVFRSSEISFTPQLFHINTSANYNNGRVSDYLYNFNLGQIGIVSSLMTRSSEKGLISLNFGYSFNKTNNLNSTTRIQGQNTTSSMADFWADQSEGTDYTDLSGSAGLAYDAWVIDTLNGSGGSGYGTAFNNYGDNSTSLYGQNVRRIITNEGYTGEHAFSIGGNYSNKLFFGATLGINRVKFTGHYEHLEKVGYSLDSGLDDFTYTEHFEDTGTGVSFKIGAIFKPTEALRIGLAFHSPTVYKIDEYFYDNMRANYDGGSDTYDYKNSPSRYSYTLTTPFRALAGIAYQIEKKGLVSLDYEFIDYSTARFSESGDNYDYSDSNYEISQMLKPTSNIRLGGEYRLDKFYLRGGYGYYGKVFESKEDNADMHHTSLSFGLGFREQNVNVDFGYVNLINSQKYILYNTLSTREIADLDVKRNIFTVTVGYKFGY